VCIPDSSDDQFRRTRWKLIIRLIIFFTVLAFATVALMINPAATITGAFVVLVVGLALKAGAGLVADFPRRS